MTQRVVLEPVFILHRRAYRNTSLIVDLFTQQYGRVTAVARSARGLQSRYRGMLQLFMPLFASWAGKSELKNLNAIEQNGMPYVLTGQALFCAFYLNELLQRLLLHDDPYPNLFEYYRQTLVSLMQQKNIESSLRYFEKKLLDELGYGLSLEHEIKTHEPFHSENYYRWLPEQGFIRCQAAQDHRVFMGRSLIALQQEELLDLDSLRDAKRLLRIALARHLGGKPLQSREMFKAG